MLRKDRNKVVCVFRSKQIQDGAPEAYNKWMYP